MNAHLDNVYGYHIIIIKLNGYSMLKEGSLALGLHIRGEIYIRLYICMFFKL